MKSMTCKQLGGACDLVFSAETFEEVAEMSQNHGSKMFQRGDKPHIRAIESMQELMQSPKALKEWVEDKRQKFESVANAQRIPRRS